MFNETELSKKKKTSENLTDHRGTNIPNIGYSSTKHRFVDQDSARPSIE